MVSLTHSRGVPITFGRNRLLRPTHLDAQHTLEADQFGYAVDQCRPCGTVIFTFIILPSTRSAVSAVCAIARKQRAINASEHKATGTRHVSSAPVPEVKITSRSDSNFKSIVGGIGEGSAGSNHKSDGFASEAPARNARGDSMTAGSCTAEASVPRGDGRLLCTGHTVRKAGVEPRAESVSSAIEASLHRRDRDDVGAGHVTIRDVRQNLPNAPSESRQQPPSPFNVIKLDSRRPLEQKREASTTNFEQPSLSREAGTDQRETHVKHVGECHKRNSGDSAASTAAEAPAKGHDSPVKAVVLKAGGEAIGNEDKKCGTVVVAATFRLETATNATDSEGRRGRKNTATISSLSGSISDTSHAAESAEIVEEGTRHIFREKAQDDDRSDSANDQPPHANSADLNATVLGNKRTVALQAPSGATDTEISYVIKKFGGKHIRNRGGGARSGRSRHHPHAGPPTVVTKATRCASNPAPGSRCPAEGPTNICGIDARGKKSFKTDGRAEHGEGGHERGSDAEPEVEGMVLPGHVLTDDYCTFWVSVMMWSTFGRRYSQFST